METILIKEVTQKGNLCIVKHFTGEATLNKGWQSDEINYLVSLAPGTAVDVEIVKKGEYTNITKVDMENTPSQNAPTQAKTQSKLLSVKDQSILAQVFMMGAIEMAKGHEFACLQNEAQYMCECVNELHGLYKYAHQLLD